MNISRTDGIEMSSFSHHEDTSRSLLRRSSATSVASNTSSQIRIQRHLFEEFLSVIGGAQTRVQQRMRTSRFYGWRMGLLFGSFTSLLVLCCNAIAIIVASQVGTKREQYRGHFLWKCYCNIPLEHSLPPHYQRFQYCFARR